MAIPKSKYSGPKHTPGKEFTLNEKEYRGWYVETFQKRYYTGKTITESSVEIFPILDTKPRDLFVEDQIIPSQKELDEGVIKRYIIQKINNRKIIEVSKQKYQQLIEQVPYTGVILTWITKGPAQDTFFNGYRYYGAEHRNKEAVLKVENRIPGLSNYFKDYAEFVE